MRKQWDYLALTGLLGLYITAKAAAVMASITDEGLDVLIPPPTFVR
jgi:hypothetical protein